MNSCEFFTAVDILTALQDEQRKALENLTEINKEITAIMGEVWELVIEAQRSVDMPDGKKYTIDLRVFNGYGDEERSVLANLFNKNGFTVKTPAVSAAENSR